MHVPPPMTYTATEWYCKHTFPTDANKNKISLSFLCNMMQTGP